MTSQKLFTSLLLVFTIFNFVFFAYPAVAATPLEQCRAYCNDRTKPIDPGLACLCSRENPKCPASDPTCTRHESGIIDRATNWIFYLGLILAPLFVLIGAFMFFTSGGDSKRATSGKKTIMWAMIGLAIALCVKIIYGLIRFLIGQ